MNYGERISHLRQKKNLTQKELASKLYVTDKTVSSWESNRTEPGLDMIVKLSEILECSASYLIYGDNNKDNIEMELKIRLSPKEYNSLNDSLNNKCQFLLETKLHDIYYQSDYMKKTNVNKTLRIRSTGSKHILTYKNLNSKMYCEEYEVEIDNKDNLKQIFEILGLKKIIEVKKVRKIYTYLDKYEVALDNVENLGYFIEIEVKKSITNFPEEYDELLKNAQKLGLNLNNLETKRYSQIMIDKKN